MQERELKLALAYGNINILLEQWNETQAPWQEAEINLISIFLLFEWQLSQVLLRDPLLSGKDISYKNKEEPQRPRRNNSVCHLLERLVTERLILQIEKIVHETNQITLHIGATSTAPSHA